MPLARYSNGLRAGKIVEITEVEVVGLGMCARLLFEDGSSNICQPAWTAENRPQVGQWFVTDTKKAWLSDKEPE